MSSKKQKFWEKVVINVNGEQLPTHYMVSSEGEVKDLRKGDELEECVLGKHGYYFIRLKEKFLPNKHASKFLVHHLVANAFIPNDDPIRKTYIIHDDGNKLNNSVTNLKWSTKRDSSYAARDRSKKIANITIREAKQIAGLLETGKYTFEEIASIVGNGTTPSIVRNIYSGLSWKDVSKDRVFINKKARKTITMKDIKEIAKVLNDSDNLSDNAICEIHGISRTTLQSLRKNSRYAKILENGACEKKKAETLSTDIVHKICAKLESDPSLTSVELGSLFNCPSGKIDAIRNGRAWVQIASGYNIINTKYFDWKPYDAVIEEHLKKKSKPKAAYDDLRMAEKNITLDVFQKHYYYLRDKLKRKDA